MNKKTRISKVICSAVAAVICSTFAVGVSADSWEFIRGNKENNGVVEAQIPTNKEQAVLYWATKVGEGWTDSPSPVTMVDDKLIYTSGNMLCAMDKTDGTVCGSVEMAGSLGYALSAPVYSDGKLFVALDGGIIQAFDAKTLESLWIYKDELGGSAYSYVTYGDGCVYAGFNNVTYDENWNPAESDASFVCINAEDEDTTQGLEEKTAVWKYTNKGGWYCSSAYVSADFLAVGMEDGGDAYGKFAVLDKSTGEVLDILDSISGDVRSCVCYDSVTDCCYFTTSGGEFYQVKIDSDGKISQVKSLDLGGSSTSTPVISGGRAYVGVSGAGWGAYNGCGIDVIDLESFSVAYKAETMGNPQVSGLCSVDDEGYNYVYFIENTQPSEIRFVKDKAGVTEVINPSIEEAEGVTHSCAPILFTPVGEQSQYAICNLICDSEGTIYFKNDSSYIMAVGSKVEELVVENAKTDYKAGEKFDTTGMTVKAVLSNGVVRDVTDKVTVSDAPLTEDDLFVTIFYDYALYGDGETAGVEVAPVQTTVDITVGEVSEEIPEDNKTDNNEQNQDNTADNSDKNSEGNSAQDSEKNPATGRAFAGLGTVLALGLAVTLKRKNK